MEAPSQSTLDSFLSTDTSTPAPAPAPTRRLERRQIRGVTWLLVEHPANIRRNSLLNESFEALQCMKDWLDNKVG